MGDMTGNYVRGCAIHRTFNRAVTIHSEMTVYDCYQLFTLPVVNILKTCVFGRDLFCSVLSRIQIWVFFCLLHFNLCFIPFIVCGVWTLVFKYQYLDETRFARF